MALTQRLELRQGQSLVMTPQLQQAIKLLQLSNLELAEYVEAEIEKNPLLERGEPEPATNGEDRQPDGESAGVVRVGSDARGARGGYRRKAWWAGSGEGRCRYVEGSHG